MSAEGNKKETNEQTLRDYTDSGAKNNSHLMDAVETLNNMPDRLYSPYYDDPSFYKSAVEKEMEALKTVIKHWKHVTDSTKAQAQAQALAQAAKNTGGDLACTEIEDVVVTYMQELSDAYAKIIAAVDQLTTLIPFDVIKYRPKFLIDFCREIGNDGIPSLRQLGSYDGPYLDTLQFVLDENNNPFMRKDYREYFNSLSTKSKDAERAEEFKQNRQVTNQFTQILDSIKILEKEPPRLLANALSEHELNFGLQMSPTDMSEEKKDDRPTIPSAAQSLTQPEQTLESRTGSTTTPVISTNSDSEVRKESDSTKEGKKDAKDNLKSDTLPAANSRIQTQQTREDSSSNLTALETTSRPKVWEEKDHTDSKSSTERTEAHDQEKIDRYYLNYSDRIVLKIYRDFQSKEKNYQGHREKTLQGIEDEILNLLLRKKIDGLEQISESLEALKKKILEIRDKMQTDHDHNGALKKLSEKHSFFSNFKTESRAVKIIDQWIKYDLQPELDELSKQISASKDGTVVSPKANS